jgi:fructuronate reductase
LRQLTDAADTPAQTVAALLGVEVIFPSDLATQLAAPVTQAAEALWATGARNAIEALA